MQGHCRNPKGVWTVERDVLLTALDEGVVIDGIDSCKEGLGQDGEGPE
jgi:hypothetical protein